ncbi:FtsX-like permease family protein [Rhodanobacter sp. DHG33]|uniref:ABC transporter permease n=1 Tax=Rhodanobacter sp. DHG33 TaxID=2775921 RepID=UPI001786ACC7|nr:FtsX-like permease family protein [Rhodanobacter sp. DHG33]MBD8899343.1 ABC transporter permease [Rhodanobacter sp. DHG33]
MELLPILSSLRRHKLAAGLLMLEIAVACAILCNAVFMIRQRLSEMQVHTGLAESELVWLKTDGVSGADATPVTESNLAALRGIPGVKSAVVVASLPLSNDDMNFNPSMDADGKHRGPNMELMVGSPGYLHALGIKLVEGHDFSADDYAGVDTWLPHSPSMIVTRAVAERLWPGQSALGQAFWIGTKRYQVIGVVDHMVRGELRGNASEYTALFAARPSAELSSLYVLRADPSALDRVLRDAAAKLAALNPQMLINDKGTYPGLRGNYFASDRAMAWLLATVCTALLIVTALGIGGLASFWVAQRRRQIGIRRAIGATRGDILRYFQTENFLIVSGGIGLGMVLAYTINLALMSHYELPRLPLAYFPVGALALWLLGQLAVLGPALRASHVPPVVATRSV